MSWGLRYKNSNAIVTIDADNNAYRYLGKFTTTAGDLYHPGLSQRTWHGNFTCQGTPVVAIDVPNAGGTGPASHHGHALFSVEDLGANNWRAHCLAHNGSSAPVIRAWESMQYYNNTGDTHGLEVYDAAGNIAFTGQDRALNLDADADLPLGGFLGSPDYQFMNYTSIAPTVYPYAVVGYTRNLVFIVHDFAGEFSVYANIWSHNVLGSFRRMWGVVATNSPGDTAVQGYRTIETDVDRKFYFLETTPLP